MQIEIDFDVYKALTQRRDHEAHSYNEVLRELLGLDSVQEPEPPSGPLQAVADALSRPLASTGFYSRGLHLPNGTKLRARYKQREHGAEVRDDRWIGFDGSEYPSASAAASAITGSNVNGLRFWEAKRPGDSGWRRLESLRDS